MTGYGAFGAPIIALAKGVRCVGTFALARPSPREQLPVPLFDGVVLAVRAGDSRIYLDLLDLCSTLGLDPSSQRRRIQASEELHLVQFRVTVELQMRTRDFLLLEDVPVWLLSVQQRRVAPEVRERFAYVKTYLVEAVRQAFAQLTGLPAAPSNTIEELGDLDRIDQTFSQLAELARRQDTIEQSQDRARSGYRDLNALLRELGERVQALEAQARNRLSPAQRASGTSPGVAFRKSWSEVNARFGVSTYTELPASRYDEVVQFVKNQYRALTGEELPANEQLGLEDIDGE